MAMPTEDPKVKKIYLLVTTNSYEKLINQINKLIDVIEVN